jgi:acetolactate synthase-1/2/3 large subunit
VALSGGGDASAGRDGPRSGGQILVDQLVIHGAELAFGLPGESYLPVLDALYDGPLRLIAARHEAGAANMAEAYGKLTGRPGICLVTRGPGATQASVGVHTAYQDSTPMILFVGQVARGTSGRGGFQELDYRQVFAPIAKWATQVEDPARLPEVIARAFSLAVSGRPGPVVVALPEDMLNEQAQASDAAPARPAFAAPSSRQLARLAELLEPARQPLAIVGEGGWTAQAGDDFVAFGRAARIPIATSFRCQDYVDNNAEVYAGHAGIGMAPALARRIAEADVLLAIGGRLGEIPSSGYTLLDIPRPRQRLVHVHPDPDELGAVYQPELGIVSGLPQFAAAARGLGAGAAAAAREVVVAEAHAEYQRNLAEARRLPGDLQLSGVMSVLRERLDADAILTCGAGNFTVWAHRYYAFRRYPSQLAPRSGSMGYGFPAAIAAKAVHPDRTVVCVAGDGDFLMAGQELATAVQENLAVVVLVVNNGMYGTIRMHQERHYPGRVVATGLVNPDFVAYARAFGAHAALVTRTEDFEGALVEALGSGRPALLELRVDPEAITPRETLSEIRRAAR